MEKVFIIFQNIGGVIKYLTYKKVLVDNLTEECIMSYYLADRIYAEQQKIHESLFLQEVNNLLISIEDRIKELLLSLKFRYTVQLNCESKYERNSWNVHVERFELTEPVTKVNIIPCLSDLVKDQVKDMIWMTNFNKPNQHKQFKLQCKDDDCSCVVTMVG